MTRPDAHEASAAEIELLPCPFCGSDHLNRMRPTCRSDDDYDPNDRAFPAVRCFNCYAEAIGDVWDHIGKSAIAAWNRRAAAAELTTLRSALARAEEREAGLVAALEWYAGDGSTYDGIDVGQRARAALALRPQSPAPGVE